MKNEHLYLKIEILYIPYDFKNRREQVNATN